MSLISELKRRNVFRMAAGYLAASWLLVQVTETTLPVFGFGEAAVRYSVIALAIGFIPALVASWAFEWTPGGLVLDERVAPDSADRARAAKTWDRVILVVLAAAVGLFAFERFIITPEREAALVEAATEAGIEMGRNRVSEIPDESVAVLPFVNMSADPDNEYFSDGLTDTLLHMLAQLNDLKVAARTSSFAFKGKNEDIRTIAQALSVAHVLEGSVQRANNSIRVTAQLIRASDGYHVWSHNFDRNLDDIFAIQDEIAAEVAIALGSTLLASNRGAITGVATTDVVAYDLYLRGLDQLLISTDTSILEADQLFTGALELDSGFTEAKIALARNFMSQSFKGLLKYEEAMPEAEQLIGEILVENPDNLAARQFQAVLEWNRIVWDQMDMTAMDSLLEEMLPLFVEGVGAPWARMQAGMMLVVQERHEEALGLIRQGLVTDPLNFDLLTAQSIALRDLDRFDEALVPLMTALKIEPKNSLVYYRIANLERDRGRFAEALPYMKQHALLDDTAPMPAFFIANLFNDAGLYEEADRWLAVFSSRNPDEMDLITSNLFSAIARGDETAARQVATDALDRSLKGEIGQNMFGPLAHNFAIFAHNDGRSQEALDYLESYFPGISDHKNYRPSNWLEYRLQYYGVIPLMYDLLDDEGAKELLEDAIANGRTFGVDYEDYDGFYLWYQYLLYGHDAGKAVIMERYAVDKPIFHPNWRQLLRSPWLRDLTDDPEVAAVIAAREARIAEIREEMRAVIEQPAWRDDVY